MQKRPPKYCRSAFHGPALLRFGSALALTAGGWHGAAAAPAELQDLAQLQSLVQSQAQRLLPALTARQRLQVGPIPPQLPLARCPGPVTASPAPGLPQAGRVLMEVRCTAAPAWHIYVPVRVIGTSPVVVAAHSLIPGIVLTEKDVRLEEHDLTQLPPGYLDDPAIAIGLTPARGIAAGASLTNQMLLGAKAVQRGQSVTLIASNGGFSVRMAGRALTDGLINQRVRVENLSSGKVVEGIARSEQVVEIIFQ